MATRLRLTAYKHTLVVAPHATWRTTALAPVLYQLISSDEAASYTKTIATTDTVTGQLSTYLATFISRPLTAQTISGTVKGQVAMFQDDALADFQTQLLIRVLDKTGAEKAVLLPHSAAPLQSELNVNALQNRRCPPAANTALAPYTCADGDLLGFEVGFKAFNTVATSYTCTLSVGSTGTAEANLP